MAEIIVKLQDNVVQKCFFHQEALTIGRSPDCQVTIENLAISREHAKIEFLDGRYFVTDLGSANGTWVNGVRVNKTEIMDKDVIAIGKHMLYLYDQRASVAARPPQTPFDGEATFMMDASIPPRITLVVNKGRQKGQRIAVTQDLTKIGRGPENDIQLTDWFVSKQHAQIERHGQRYAIRDLASWRHTFVNGEAVTEAPLHPGDVVLLGPTVELLFETSDAPPSGPRVPVELGDRVAPAANSPAPEIDAAEAETVTGSSRAAVGAPSQAGQPLAAPRGLDASVAALVTGGFEPRHDPADAVCEDLAEVSLQVAADAVATSGSPKAGATGGPGGGNSGEIALWERALANPSPVIRKQAARRLKQLTGRDYDY